MSHAGNHHTDDRHLVDRGLTNYRGQHPQLPAPDLRYSTRRGHGESVLEFKRMVRALHCRASR
jgi:pullulanase/glycogen debranching enzyme